MNDMLLMQADAAALAAAERGSLILKKNQQQTACVFLKDKKCSIYQHRPLQVGGLGV